MLTKNEILSFFERDFREHFELNAHTLPADVRSRASRVLKRSSVFSTLDPGLENAQTMGAFTDMRDEMIARVYLIRAVTECVHNDVDPYTVFKDSGSYTGLRGVLKQTGYYFTETYSVLIHLFPDPEDQDRMSVDERVELFLNHMEFYRGAGIEGLGDVR